MTSIDMSTGESQNTGRSPRFTMWVAFAVFSAICLGASVEVKKASSSPSAAAKWAVTCSCLTMALSGAVVVAHLMPVLSTLITGTVLEGILTVILAAFWAAFVSIVTNASNGLGVDGGSSVNQVTNGNLYYFGWAGFVTSILLLVSYLRSAFGVDVVGEVRHRSARLTWWAGMLASAIVVMGSSIRTQNQDCSSSANQLQQFDSVYCKRTKFAISLGALGLVLSLLVICMKLLLPSLGAPFLLEFTISVILAILNAFGVAYITSAKGPGSPIGNLYYFSWISFLCAAMLAADCFGQFTGANAGPTGEIDNNGTSSGAGGGNDMEDPYGGHAAVADHGKYNPQYANNGNGQEIQVETFDDNRL